MWPFSSRVYQSVLTPARTATSSRRRPGTRRRPPPGSSPACCGVSRARRLARKSRMSERLSTASTLRRLPAAGRSCFYPPQTRPPARAPEIVPVGARPGENGALLPAQTGDPSTAAARQQPRLLRREPGAAAGEEVADVGAVVHRIDATSPPRCREVVLLPPTNPTPRACARRGSVESTPPLVLRRSTVLRGAV